MRPPVRLAAPAGLYGFSLHTVNVSAITRDSVPWVRGRLTTRGLFPKVNTSRDFGNREALGHEELHGNAANN